MNHEPAWRPRSGRHLTRFARCLRRDIVRRGGCDDDHRPCAGRDGAAAGGLGGTGAEQGAVGARARGAGQDDAAHFNDANVTGNYRCFHAKLSKPFREQFPVERLERTFREFNKKHLDFDIIAAMKPAYDPRAAGRRRRQAAGEGLLSHRAAAGLFRSGLHPVGRRMEADPNQRQGRFAAVTASSNRQERS